ncbi:hypothetical protein ACFFRR_000012 [Megaselia abdita]
MEYDWKTCRVCLSQEEDVEEMQSIFKENSSAEEIATKIERCGGIKISRSATYAKMICAQCFINLTVANKFWKEVQESHEKLKDLETIINPLSLKSEGQEEIEINIESDEVLGDYEDMLTGEGEHYMVYDEKEQVVEEKFLNGTTTTIEIEEITNVKDKKSSKVKVLFGDNNEDQYLVVESNPDIKTTVKKEPTKEKKIYPPDPHICEVCGNSFKSKSILNLHMRRHQNIRPFKCEICSKNFACHSEISRHIRVHTGAKPFSCKYCDRKFSDRSTNIKHERTHTNERPFVCDTCGRAFMYSNVLKNHKLTHTGEKSFQCVPCNKTFARQHQLQQHLGTLIHKQTAVKVEN